MARLPLMDANSTNPLEASIARARAERSVRLWLCRVCEQMNNTDDRACMRCGHVRV